MVRIDRIRVRLYDWVKLFLAALVAMGVATTGVALASAAPASATATPVIANVSANYSLTGTPMPKAFTGTAPANQADASLSAAVSNPSTATTLSFTSVSQTYVFSPVGQVDVYAACSDTATGSQLPSYIFAYTGNPFTESGTSVSGGTGLTGVSLVYTNPACSSTTAIASGSEVYQTGAPSVTYALANVSGGAPNVNTASLQIITQPSLSNGYATVDPTTGQIYMQPQPTASGNFSLTYAYCAPGVTLTSDPGGLSDGNCATATVNYLDATHCELVGENVTVSISSSTIYQAICASTVAPATVTPGQTFTYDTIAGSSVIPVEESTSIGNATIQYGDNFVSIVPVPAGVTYVPGSAKAVGGDPTTRGQATVKYCTAPTTGCDGTLSGNYKTTYPYIELELPSSVHINGGSLVTLPYAEAQFTATGAPGTQIGTALSEFRLNTQVDIPIIGSNTAAFDGYPTTCGSPPQNSSSAGCPTSGTPAYSAPTIYPFTEIVPGVTSVTTAGGAASGSDTGGQTVHISGSGFTGATAVDFGSTPATSFTVNSDSSITAVSPPGADGSVDITVVTGGATSSTSSADQFTFIPPSVPDAPSGIQVTPGDGSAADGAATVSWSPTFGEGSDVTGYTVTAADNTSPSNPTATCTSTDPTDSCSLSGLVNGDSYTFSIVATNATGTSAAGTATVTEGAPTPPTSVAAVAGQESAAVSFAAPAVSGDGSSVTGYTVTATDTTSPGNGGETASGSASPITVPGLTDGDSYTFTVTATNASGTSLSSAASAATTPLGVPGAPTAVSGTSNANAQSVVSWTAPSATHGSAIVSYKVTATDTTTSGNGGQTCSYTIPTPPPDTNTYSCTVTGLTNGDAYVFTATATNGVGTGPASAASAAAVPSTTPGAPTGVTAVSNPDGTVQVTWVAPASNGGSPITSYTATSSSGSKTCTTADGTTLTCAVSGTTIGTSYTYSVKATNANGTSAASTASASVKTTSLPAAPTAVSGTGSPEQVSVSFTGDTTTATEGGLTITGYTVTATDLTNPANGGQTATGTSSPIVVTGLTDLDNYTFTVHATNSVGNSPESAASAQVAPGGVPSVPLNVTATNISPGGNAQVSWTPPATPGGTISKYTVTSSTGSKTCTYTGPFGPGETDTCTVSGLTIGTSYTYSVTATNQSGTSSSSAASNAVVSSTTPNAPTSPSATTGNGTATVAFTGDTTTATEGGIAITGYSVTATDVTNPANGGQTATGTVSPVTVTGLTNGDSYTFTVHATNANGNSAESTATAAVNPGRPSAPTAVVSSADPSSSTTLDVSWAAASSPDGTSPITGYTVTSSPGSLTCTTTGATTCNVTGLTAKTAYTFTVTATNQYGTSPASSASTSQNAGYPGIPTGVTVAQVSPIGANASTASIVVSWTVPNNGGSAITTQTATSSSGSKTCTDNTHVTAGQTASCTMTGLTTGTSYTVTVKDANANGTGSASAASAAIVPQTLPAAPTALVAATGDRQETVSFTGDTTASTEGGSAITGYTVTASPGGATCTTTTTSCTITGLTDGTSYTFTATATTVNGTSVASAASAALVAGVPTPPTAVVSGADATSSTTLDVSWAAATSPDGTSPITGYTVTSSPGSFTCTTTGATSCNVSGLTAKTAYTFTVKATNQYGTGVASAASTSQNAGYPGIPTGVTAVRVLNVANASTGQVTVSWTVPNNGGSAITTQTATSSSGSKTCTDNTHVTAGQTASCTVTGLTSGTAYTFTVKDVNANGTGTASTASNSVTVETVPPAPTAVTGSAGLQSATVSFTAPSTTNSGAISSYTVTATDTTNAANGGQTATGASSPITVTGLTVGDTYTFTVQATGVDGTGLASTASAGVVPSNVPDAPAAPSVTAGDQLAVVSWTPPFAEYSPITSYTVSDGVGDTCTTSSTSCTVTGLTDGTAYTFTVTASNADGAGAASNASAPVTPLHTAITSASATTFVNGSAGTFTVTADGTPAITYAESGALPNGVSLDPSSGILSGTPSVTPDGYGDYPITVTANSALSGTDTQSFTLTVDAAPAITSAAATTFTVGSAGNFTVAATGYPQPTFSETGALPSGVSLDPLTGQLSGTPAAGTGGAYPVTLTATNGVAPDDSQAFTLTVDQSTAITSVAATTLTVGSAGSFPVTTTGYPAPTFSETGALPGGVTLNPSSGVLSGTPAASTGGVYHVTISATNGVGAPATQSFTLTVDQAAAITSATTATVTQGINQSVTVTATGYPAPTFTETGTLPSGYTLSPAGVLSGNTFQVGTFSITLKASNGIGATATQSFTLTVLGAAPAITSAAAATFTVGQAGSFTITASGAPTPSISTKSKLPAGVTLTDHHDGTATLAGTPAAGTGKAYTVALYATSSSGTAKQVLTVTVYQAPVITTTATTKSGKVGKAFSYTLKAKGFPAPTFSASSLPAGVTLTNLGSGKATLSGFFLVGTQTFTITAANGHTPNATVTFTLTGK